MKKEYTKAMGSGLIISLVLSSLPAASVKASELQVTRIGESNRYATASKVAATNWENPENVILVSGEGYADSVSASVLAKQLDAPILLSTSTELNSDTKNALDKLKPKNIYIIGGNASISQSIRDELKKSSYNLIELKGNNRYETNTEVAKKLVELGMKADNVLLVSGEGFSDALSVAPIAAAKNQILLLGNNNQDSMKSVLDFIKFNNSKVTVVGTSYSINDTIYNTLDAVKRINGGSNRFETNLNVLNEFKDDLKGNSIFVANASGNGYADALVASALAGKSSSNLVLVDTEDSSSTSSAIDYIKSKIDNSTDINIIGGKSVVPDTIIDMIKGTTPIPTGDPTVNSISDNGLNQIKILFNTQLDKDTAELLKNYEIDGNSLSSATASASLQDNKKTVLITLSKSLKQNSTVKVTVKDGIFDKSLTNTISKFEKKIDIMDITAPTLQSVTPVGGNKLIVKFSEPVRMDKSSLSSMKINRQSISNYSLNTSESEFHNNSGEWSDTAELYFNTTLPIGTNTFSIPDGTVGTKFDDAAGFSVKSSSLDFTIDSIAGLPEVTGVKSDGNDTIYITYNRPMDKQTALEDSNYKINNSTVSVSSNNISFEDDSDDKVVKIKGLNYMLENGENSLTIRDNIRDTYGNNINETNLTFDVGNNTTKPEVSSVTILDKNTIRVKFNKDVNNSYATDESNYKLLDSSGNDISYKIDDIISASSSSSEYRNTYYLKFKDPNRLIDSQYTLTIKNIVDRNDPPNVMDTITKTISNTTSSSPAISSEVKKADDEHSVVVFFNKTMDKSSIEDSSNYYIKTGDGKSQKIPSDTKIYSNSDNKSVTLEFPSSYSIGNEKYEDYINSVGVSDVTDTDGNTMIGLYFADKISTSYTDGPKLVDNSGKLTYDGNDIKVQISLTAPLDILNIGDFKVAGKTPDAGTISGNDIILIFKSGIKNDEKIDTINNSGRSTTVNISGRTSVDVAGRKIQTASDTLLIPPKTVTKSWSTRGGYISSSTLVFNQNIDKDIEQSYNDDFIFTDETTGEKLNVASVIVDDKNITYKFDNNSVNVGDKIKVQANSDSSALSIRSEDDDDDYYSVYSPTSDDLGGIILTAEK
ncbi:cell wall-binding repeat-containing protein [Clostridium sp. JNZ X4-2]